MEQSSGEVNPVVNPSPAIQKEISTQFIKRSNKYKKKIVDLPTEGDFLLDGPKEGCKVVW
ncbi:MAG: hypothetical protein GY820_30715 [Gammaproteobacteria bacterium]|nr:hypothetical protein [Gammaproteobacteria bacterium]